jgi:hypothetical protein
MVPKPGSAAAFKHLNSLRAPPSTLRDGPGPKRQKSSERDTTSQTSHYFTKDKPESEIDADFEIVSSASAESIRGNTRKPHINQPRLNLTLATYGKRTRNRKRQNSIIQHEHLGPRSKTSVFNPDIAADSPDALALGDPPPANIVSDIGPDTRSRKRARQGPSTVMGGPSIKRNRPSHTKEEVHGSDSEDELTSQPAVKTAMLGTRKTNFSDILGRRLVDLTPTKFTRRERPSTNIPQTQPLHLVRACTPREYYDGHGGGKSNIRLCPEGSPPGRFRARDEHGKPMLLQWLTIDLAKVTACQYDPQGSCHVNLIRSVTETFGKLFLEFGTKEEAAALVNAIRRPSIRFQVVEGSVLRALQIMCLKLTAKQDQACS